MTITTVLSVLLALLPQDHDTRASPFDGLRWSDGTPETLIAGVWYQPVAIELLPRVTLLGTASSGGSARSRTFELPETGIEARCASMASFRPDGRLYDGRGIEVDVEVLPAPDDFLREGGDEQLDAAVRLLQE